MLILLQAVLGFDNLLYISLESKKAPEDKQSMVRKWGIGLAIILRIGLLFLLIHLIEYFQDPFWKFDNSFAHGNINVHSVIVLVGGAFIIYTAVKEIWHMLSLEHGGKKGDDKPRSTRSVIIWIVIMNIVFSFDSILSAMALTDTFWVMAVAIVVSGLLMMWLSDRVSNFLRKNRMYEVLGLFVLFIVGIMLVTEGGHLGHLEFFGNEIVPMSKTTFYFVLAILVIVEIVQSRYQKKIDSLDEEEEIKEKSEDKVQIKEKIN
jgi:predicted tellurium resistance membrane protein TerC